MTPSVMHKKNDDILITKYVSPEFSPTEIQSVYQYSGHREESGQSFRVLSRRSSGSGKYKGLKKVNLQNNSWTNIWSGAPSSPTCNPVIETDSLHDGLSIKEEKFFEVGALEELQNKDFHRMPSKDDRDNEDDVGFPI
jgi:hypothetical protein